MNPELEALLRQMLGVPADATRAPVPAPPRQPTIGPAPSAAARERLPRPRSGVIGAVLDSAEPSADTPLGRLNETLNPIRAGAQARELVGQAVNAAGRGNVGRALASGALAAMAVPGVPGNPSAARAAGNLINVDGVLRPRLNSAGQLIHPTEDGIRNFWRTAPAPELLDEAGRPLVVYHGTGRRGIPRRGFEAFDPNRTMDGSAGWFAGDRAHGEMYDEGGLYEMYLRGQRPLMMPPLETATRSEWFDAMRQGGADVSAMRAEPWSGFTEGDAANPITQFWELLENQYGNNNIVPELRRQGFDVVVAPPEQGFPGRNYVALNPNIIKSATHNRGTFDPRDPRYKYAILGMLGLGGASAATGQPE